MTTFEGTLQQSVNEGGATVAASKGEFLDF